MNTPSPSVAPPPLRTDETLDEWMPAFSTLDPEDALIPSQLPVADLASEIPAPLPMPTPMRNRAQFHWSQQRYLLENIKLADAKAGFVITLASASLSAFFTHTPSISGPLSSTTILIGLLTALGLSSLIAAIAFGAWSIKPRIGSRREASPLSWTDIAFYPTLTAYQEASRLLNEEETTEALSEQVFFLSHICHRKHLLIARAIILAMTGGLALILDLTVSHLARH